MSSCIINDVSAENHLFSNECADNFENIIAVSHSLVLLKIIYRFYTKLNGLCLK